MSKYIQHLLAHTIFFGGISHRILEMLRNNMDQTQDLCVIPDCILISAKSSPPRRTRIRTLRGRSASPTLSSGSSLPRFLWPDRVAIRLRDGPALDSGRGTGPLHSAPYAKEPGQIM